MLDANSDGKVDFNEFKAIAEQNETHEMVAAIAAIAARDNGHVLDLPERDDFQALRDKRLATADTRKFCLDRCLATGYCDALEDLLEMTTMQVKTFCDECGKQDECELSYA